MVDIEYIRKRFYVDGWSKRQISRQLQISRQAVRKALSSAEPPRYKLTKPKASPVMDQYREVILSWLAADETAPPKQRHTAKRIYDRLVEEFHFTGGESTVRRFVARLRPKAPEAFISLAAGWGEEAQVDWGNAVVRIAGVQTEIHLFCLRMRASGVPFVWASPTEKLEAFLEGHVRAFEWLGGVPAANHGRCHQRGETVMVLEHYLPTLARKPRAAAHAAIVWHMPPIYTRVRDKLCAARPDGYRDFAAILLLHKDFPANEVAAALEEADARGCLQAHAVRQILLNRLTPPAPPSIQVPANLARMIIEPPDLSRYDGLLAGVRR